MKLYSNKVATFQSKVNEYSAQNNIVYGKGLFDNIV